MDGSPDDSYLRLSAELLGPEYSMKWNSLDSGLDLFFSRAVQGRAGEDLVEKQNAELGMMPVVPMEAAVYGYEAEDRHFVRAFLGKERPLLTFDDPVAAQVAPARSGSVPTCCRSATAGC